MTVINLRDELLYTGTQLIRVPYPILKRLHDEDAPVFKCWDYTIIDNELSPQGVNHSGKHSDVHFWYRVRSLDPCPPIEILGPCRWIKNPMNAEHDLTHPCKLELVG